MKLFHFHVIKKKLSSGKYPIFEYFSSSLAHECIISCLFQAYELSTLTGTQVMLLVASETGHVYTFATRKLQPMITSENGKALIQTCLNSPDVASLGGGSNPSQELSTSDLASQDEDDRMNPGGFEETALNYTVEDDQPKVLDLVCIYYFLLGMLLIHSSPCMWQLEHLPSLEDVITN